jgi:hypothetical protein
VPHLQRKQRSGVSVPGLLCNLTGTLCSSRPHDSSSGIEEAFKSCGQGTQLQFGTPKVGTEQPKQHRGCMEMCEGRKRETNRLRATWLCRRFCNPPPGTSCPE